MGEFADMAIEEMFDEYEHYEKYKNEPLSVQYEEGLIDEHGVTIGNPFAPPPSRFSKPAGKAVTMSGPGTCPKCGGGTKLINGKFGDFYGCLRFPECSGSRSA